MKSKDEIVADWLPRYTGTPLEEFGKYILLVNFSNYVRMFAEWHEVPVRGEDRPMLNATANGITIINFGMGSANAATIMDLLCAVQPKACLFLGKCGGLKKKNKLGDLILPIAAIRGEGTSNDYFPPEVPALPAFSLQKAISTTIRNHGAITGPARSIPPTAACGSTMRTSRSICGASGAWPLTWRRRRSSSPGSTTRFPAARCCWCPISRWCRRGSRPRRAIRR